MEVTVTDINSVKKKVQIQVPQADVAKELDSAYLQLKKNAKVKGFRPGKTPRSILERMFHKDVHADVTNALIQNTFIDAVKQESLAFIGTPDIDPPELDPNGPFIYDITVELKPELSDISFEGVELKKTLYAMSEAEVDKQIEMLQKQLAETQPIDEDRAAADGDHAIIDYEGLKDGNPFEQTQKTENYTLKIGQKMISEEFDKQIIGMTPGEQKEFPVTFPEDYHNKELANLEITFTATLKELRQEVLPDANDELAKKLGNFETLEDVKNAIRKNLQEGYDKRSDQEIQEQIFEKLLTEKFELPETLVKFELDGIIADTEMRFSQSNVTLDQLGLSREKLEEQYRDVAENQVRRHLFLSKIIEQEKMELPEDELNTEYESLSKTVEQPVDFIKEYYQKNPDKLEGFKHAILEKKVFDLIIEKAVIKEVEPEAADADKSFDAASE
ncbi:MAG: trigger factor [Desulfobacteraceae bacterium]|nr:trigger factor [Desulfobacteraceae bacterium]MBC2755140.1 trigger factor [Desulfobacteraceae bacterium]